MQKLRAREIHMCVYIYTQKDINTVELVLGTRFPSFNYRIPFSCRKGSFEIKN